MADPGLKCHNNADSYFVAAKQTSLKNSKPTVSKSTAVIQQNSLKMSLDVGNTKRKEPSSVRGAPSGDANGCHSTPLKLESHSDEPVERKKLKLDDQVYVRTSPAQIRITDNLSPTTVFKRDISIEQLGETSENVLSVAASNTSESSKQQSPPGGGASGRGGSFMAGSHVFKNSILDEVLNEKKLSILQSPEVIQFLQQAQLKRKTTETDL